MPLDQDADWDDGTVNHAASKDWNSGERSLMSERSDATWDRPDFADPRFAIERVSDAATCRYEGCDRRADHLVEYTMHRDGWTYEYEAGYCDEHLPDRARAMVLL